MSCMCFGTPCTSPSLRSTRPMLDGRSLKALWLLAEEESEGCSGPTPQARSVRNLSHARLRTYVHSHPHRPTPIHTQPPRHPPTPLRHTYPHTPASAPRPRHRPQTHTHPQQHPHPQPDPYASGHTHPHPPTPEHMCAHMCTHMYVRIKMAPTKHTFPRPQPSTRTGPNRPQGPSEHTHMAPGPSRAHAQDPTKRMSHPSTRTSHQHPTEHTQTSARHPPTHAHPHPRHDSHLTHI